ncbi:MAG: sialate O-acetylesterase, partial [Kiritimatiellia bacterium]
MKIFIRFFIVAQLMLTAFNDSRADVKLPSIFSDHMVLQKGVEVPVWGRAEPGEKVTVSIAGQNKNTVAGKNGKWQVKLDRLEGTNAMTMVVRGKNTIEIKDVLAGEVWLCAGQSNMEMGLGGARDSAKEASSADFPVMRAFRVEHSSQVAPADDCAGEWIVCSPQTAGKFSAAAFFFGRDIHQRLNTPVGLINASWGGTLIEAWTSLEGNSTIPEFKAIAAILAKPSAPGWDENAAAALYEKKLAAYRSAADKARAAKAKLPSPPRKPVPARLNKNVPGNLFNGMIHPLIPYALRGAIWYQGESNAFVPHAKLYSRQLGALIEDWRARWGYEFPFAWVQLPEFSPLNNYGLAYWPVICEEMLKSLSIPRTGMAVGLGLGEADNIHPRDKQGIGKRLALWALADIYGQKDVTWNGPLMEEYKIKGNEIIISFKHAEGGLIAKDDVLKGFIIAGEDRKWFKADAKIKGTTVVVSRTYCPNTDNDKNLGQRSPVTDKIQNTSSVVGLGLSPIAASATEDEAGFDLGNTPSIPEVSEPVAVRY